MQTKKSKKKDIIIWYRLLEFLQWTSPSHLLKALASAKVNGVIRSGPLNCKGDYLLAQIFKFKGEEVCVQAAKGMASYTLTFKGGCECAEQIMGRVHPLNFSARPLLWLLNAAKSTKRISNCSGLQQTRASSRWQTSGTGTHLIL